MMRSKSVRKDSTQSNFNLLSLTTLFRIFLVRVIFSCINWKQAFNRVYLARTVNRTEGQRVFKTAVKATKVESQVVIESSYTSYLGLQFSPLSLGCHTIGVRYINLQTSWLSAHTRY